ncbi:MAG: PfkB family carbohydrate kinase [Limnochordia bacterium]|jgi:hypothetical protein|nr:PfkB family carbohydrate kinase [Limnochordia bacterium]NLO95847.1 carbohydrate kinase family protein [Bacillota bacterium]HAN94045.1 hypothetical protein [Bacillota bacterium]HOB41022.1 PfkB family carbohydrate kinase [Limnochordia bacterium]HOK32240.1 PfkB family carbohydrate kinase [Limnochordia bacterium]
MQELLRTLHKRLEGLSPAGLRVVVGFDGFVDEIVEAVDRRHSFASYTRMTKMEQFGQRILKAAGLSTNIELVPKAIKLGGNGPIMANALVKCGTSVTYMGSLGTPNIHPVFGELVEGCSQVYAIAEPGHTDAVEFDDGKIMLGKMEGLHAVTWEALQEVVGVERLKAAFTDCDLAATINWTMTPFLQDIWDGLLGLLEPREDGTKPFLFIDLCDPGKRQPEDLLRALETMREFARFYRVILGLNRKEATEVANVRRLQLGKPAEEADLEEIVTALGEDLGLWCLMVHPVSAAGAYLEGQYFEVEGPFTSKPRLTTGAGDNFNAGFCLGLMLKLEVEYCLALGKAVSGFYVRQMRSPSWQELLDFVDLWAHKHGEDF